jgi:hypothetical protein
MHHTHTIQAWVRLVGDGSNLFTINNQNFSSQTGTQVLDLDVSASEIVYSIWTRLEGSEQTVTFRETLTATDVWTLVAVTTAFEQTRSVVKFYQDGS